MSYSIKKNLLYNIIKTATNTVLPFIAIPYLIRVLTPDYIGKIEFGVTFVGYFSLLATLGIDVYAIRECSKVRNDKDKLAEISSQIFSINICTMIVSYVLMFVTMFFFQKLESYTSVILICSLTIFFNILGTSWINNAMEDFGFITGLTFVLQLISLIAVFIFVKTPSDYNIRCLILVFPTVFGGIINCWYKKRFCKVKFTLDMHFKEHFKSIIMLFCMLVSQTVFNNVDIIMLGLMKNDYEVGIYSTAVKSVAIVGQFIGSILWVILPGLSIYFGNNDVKKQKECLGKAFSFLVTLGFPCVVGIFILSKEIIMIIGGSDYVEACLPMRILCVSFVFSLFGMGFCGNFILLPAKKEKIFMIACTITACTNVVANFFVIPWLGAVGAAVTTAFGNLLAFIILFPYAVRVVLIDNISRKLIGPFIGCIGIALVCFFVYYLNFDFILRVILSILGSVGAYGVILFATKNELIVSFRKSKLK